MIKVKKPAKNSKDSAKSKKEDGGATTSKGKGAWKGASAKGKGKK